MKIRTFISVDIAEDVKKKIAEFQKYLKQTNVDAGWVAPGNLHITLKFIGYLDEEKIASVIEIIKNAVFHINPFDVSYVGVGTYPASKNPRIIFVQVKDSGGTLADIHERLDNQLMTLGIEHESRQFDGHITVGRIKTRKNVKGLLEHMRPYNDFHFGSERISHIALMKSDLSPTGAVYTKIHTINLY